MHSSRMRTGRTLTVFCGGEPPPKNWRPPKNLETPRKFGEPPQNLETPQKFGAPPGPDPACEQNE